MSAKKQIESLLAKMHLATAGDEGYPWLQVGLLEAINELKELREIALIDAAREVASQVVVPILGTPEAPEAPVSHAPVQEHKHEPKEKELVDTTPRIVTGYVEPVDAAKLVNVIEAFEQVGESTPVVEEAKPAPSPVPAKKAAKNNKE